MVVASAIDVAIVDGEMADMIAVVPFECHCKSWLPEFLANVEIWVVTFFFALAKNNKDCLQLFFEATILLLGGLR